MKKKLLIPLFVAGMALPFALQHDEIAVAKGYFIGEFGSETAYVNHAVTVNDQMAEEGRIAVERLVIGQQIVNVLKSIYNVNIDNLSATVEENKITFHGIASSSVIVEQAMKYASLELPEYEFASDVSVVQDFKTHRG